MSVEISLREPTPDVLSSGAKRRSPEVHESGTVMSTLPLEETLRLLARAPPIEAVEKMERQTFSQSGGIPCPIPSSSASAQEVVLPFPPTAETTDEGMMKRQRMIAEEREAQEELCVLRTSPTECNLTAVPEVFVAFNQPMIEISSHDTPPPIPIRISPDIPILRPSPSNPNWEWVGTTAVKWTPKEGGRLPKSTEFVVTIPSGDVSRSAVTGRGLSETLSFRFGTARISTKSVKRFFPDSSDFRFGQAKMQVTPDRPIIFVSFDQEIDVASICRGLEATESGNEGQTHRFGPITPEGVRAVIETRDDSGWMQKKSKRLFDGYEDSLKEHEKFPKKSLFLRCESLLPLGKDFVVRLPPGSYSAEGPHPSTEVTVCGKFSTYGPFFLEAHQQEEEKEYRPLEALSFDFSNELDLDAFDTSMVTVSPVIEDLKIRIDQSTMKRVNVTGITVGETVYSIEFSPLLRDIFGQSLIIDDGEKKAVVQRTISAAPQRFSTRRNFEMHVHDASSSSSPTLAILSVNVTSARVVVYQVNPSDFHKALGCRRRVPEDGEPPPSDDEFVGGVGKRVWEGHVSISADRNTFKESEFSLRPFLQLPTECLGQLLVYSAPGDPDEWEETAWEKRPRCLNWVQSTRTAVEAVCGLGNVAYFFATNLEDGLAISEEESVEFDLYAPPPEDIYEEEEEEGEEELEEEGELPYATHQMGPDGLCSATGVRHDSLVCCLRGDQDVAFVPHLIGLDLTHERCLAYVITDRNLYRPGETVSVKGFIRKWIFRSTSGKQLSVPNRFVLQWIAKDAKLKGNSWPTSFVGSSSREIGSGHVTVENGAFFFSFQLPKTNLTLGACSITLSGGDVDDLQCSFSCLEFRTPEYKCSVSVPETSVVGDTSFVATGKAEYFTSGGVSDAKTTWDLSRSPASFTPQGWSFKGFSFGCTQKSPAVGNDTLSGRTDGQGVHKACVSIRSSSGDEVERRCPFRLSLSMRISDLSFQMRSSSSAEILVHPSSLYVGIQSSRYANVGDPIPVKVIVTDVEGNSVAGVPIKLSVIRLIGSQRSSSARESLLEKLRMGGSSESLIQKLSLSLDSQVKVEEQVVGEPLVVVSESVASEFEVFAVQTTGDFMLLAQVRDSADLSNWASQSIHVVGEVVDCGSDSPQLHAEKPLLKVVTNQKSYSSGETAKILVTLPFGPPAEVAAFIFSNGAPLYSRATLQESPSCVLSIPVQSHFAPNALVRVIAVGKKEGGGPAYATREFVLEVSSKESSLDVEITPVKGVLRPGESSWVRIRVGRVGEKEEEEKAPPESTTATLMNPFSLKNTRVSMIIVDEAILSSTDYSICDPGQAFSAKNYTLHTVSSFRNRIGPGSERFTNLDSLNDAASPRRKWYTSKRCLERFIRRNDMKEPPPSDWFSTVAEPLWDPPEEIFVETLTGKAISLVVCGFDTVRRVKELIQNSDGIPPDQQRIVWGGMQLEDDRCLIDYWIPRGATLHLVLRMKGGGCSTLKMPKPAAPAIVNDPILLREDFNPLAVFVPDASVNSNGEVVLPFTLPDNLTSYRIWVLAANGANRFGLAESSLKARLPVSLHPTVPRYLNLGDQAQFRCVVENGLEEDVTVNVAARVSNLRLMDPFSCGQRIMIPKLQRAALQFPVTTDEVGTCHFQVVAEVGCSHIADAVEKSLPVYAPATNETVVSYGVLDDENPILVQPLAVPSDVSLEFGGLEIASSSTGLQGMTDAFLYLLNHEFDSMESICCRMLSICTLKKVLTAFNCPQVPSEAKLAEVMKDGLSVIENAMRTDGSVGLWSSSSSKPNLYLSLFAGLTLAMAEAEGYSVDDDLLAKSRLFCSGFFERVKGEQKGSSTSTIASLCSFSLFVLAQFAELKPATQQEPELGGLLGSLDLSLSFLQTRTSPIFQPSFGGGLSLGLPSLLQKTTNEESLKLQVVKTALSVFREFVDHVSPEAMAWLASAVCRCCDSRQDHPLVKWFLDQCTSFVTETSGKARVVRSGYEESREGGLAMLHSPRRTEAVILDALVETDPRNELIPKLVRGLLASRQRSGHWASIQDNAFVLLALRKYFEKIEGEMDPDFVVRIWLGEQFCAGEMTFRGREVETQLIDVPMRFLSTGRIAAMAGSEDEDEEVEGESGSRREEVKSLTLSKEGSGTCHYRLKMVYCPTTFQMDSLDRGFSVSRAYEGVSDPSHATCDCETNTWTFVAGELIRVKLLLRNLSPRHHVALVDPIPAGCEIVHLNLIGAPLSAALKPVPPSLQAGGQSIIQPRSLELSPMTPSESLSSSFSSSSVWYDHVNCCDDRLQCFAESLECGTHEYQYVVAATALGKFAVAPAKAEEMHDPEIFGRTSSASVLVVEELTNVKEAEEVEEVVLEGELALMEESEGEEEHPKEQVILTHPKAVSVPDHLLRVADPISTGSEANPASAPPVRKPKLFGKGERGIADVLSQLQPLASVDWSSIALGKELGSGAFGSVHTAKWRSTPVAVKLLHGNASDIGEHSLRQFGEEARLMSLFSHPAILQYYGLAVVVEPKSPQIAVVMELCDGSWWDSIRAKKSLTPLRLKLVQLRQVAQGMDYLHSMCVIHRDLKPENVLVKKDDCKIADFGLSKRISVSCGGAQTSVVGTYMFMAPEITRGVVGYDGKVDVFSYAITAYIILTENPRPYGSSELPLHLAFQVANNPSRRPPLTRTTLPSDNPALHDLITDCWAHEPDDRPSFSGIVDRLGMVEKAIVLSDELWVLFYEGGEGKEAGVDEDEAIEEALDGRILEKTRRAMIQCISGLFGEEKLVCGMAVEVGSGERARFVPLRSDEDVVELVHTDSLIRVRFW